MGLDEGNLETNHNEMWKLIEPSLETIEESMNEKNMPQFNPPIPKNHKELVIQWLIYNEGTKPNKNSIVELLYSGWICEEGQLWCSSNQRDCIRSTTPLIIPWDVLDPLVKNRSDVVDPLIKNSSDVVDPIIKN